MSISGGVVVVGTFFIIGEETRFFFQNRLTNSPVRGNSGNTRGSSLYEERSVGMSTTATTQATQAAQATELTQQWASDPRWRGATRTYTAQDVIRLRGSVQEEHTLARRGAERLWDLVNQEGYINALGAMTGNQAVQQVRAGLKAIYLS